MSAADSTIIDRDLACRGCGYNLRGLDIARSCPECGQTIVQTLLSPTITEAQWLRTLALGSLLIGTSLALGGVSAVAAFFAHQLNWLFTAFPLSCLIGAIGTWFFATPNDDHANTSPRSAVVLRITAIATCTLQLHLTAQVAQMFRAPSSPEMLLFSVRVTLAIWAATAALTCYRATMLAKRLGDRLGFLQAAFLTGFAPASMLPVALNAQNGLLLRYSTAVIAIVSLAWSSCFFIFFALTLRNVARNKTSPTFDIPEEQACLTTT